MNGINAATPPGSFYPDFTPFSVFAPDGSGTALTIETILADPNDNCLILGCHKTSSGHAPCLVKYSFSGEQDLKFGNNGYAFIDLMGDADTKDMGQIRNILRLPDGEYVVRLDAIMKANDSGLERSGLALARFTSEGRKDMTFGQGGVAIFPLDPPPDEDEAVKSSDFPDVVSGDMKALADGKTLLLGSAVNKQGTHRTYVLRLLADGSLDTSLNASGVVVLGAILGTWFRPYRIAEQTGDGKFVISAARPGIPFVARFHTDGRHDDTYGEQGDFTDLSDPGYAVWYQLLPTDSGLICVGRVGDKAAGPGAKGTLVITKVNSEGCQVAEFHGGKTVYIQPDDVETDFALWNFDAMLDCDQRITIVGKRLVDLGKKSSFVARLNPDGARDPEMGIEGVVYHPIPEAFSALALHPQGEGYYVAGQATGQDDKIYRIVSQGTTAVTRT